MRVAGGPALDALLAVLQVGLGHAVWQLQCIGCAADDSGPGFRTGCEACCMAAAERQGCQLLAVPAPGPAVMKADVMSEHLGILVLIGKRWCLQCGSERLAV